MLWLINGEEYEFSNWQELGTALRDLSAAQGPIQVQIGELCSECNGQGDMVAFTSNGVNIVMECNECRGTGIKSFIS
jgi:DnaJ-class molecular chaperone